MDQLLTIAQSPDVLITWSVAISTFPTTSITGYGSEKLSPNLENNLPKVASARPSNYWNHMWIYGGFPESGYPNHPNLDHFSIETYGSGHPTFQETPIDFCISIILYEGIC